MARRRKSNSGFLLLLFIIIFLVILLIFLQENKNKKKLLNNYKRIKNRLKVSTKIFNKKSKQQENKIVKPSYKRVFLYFAKYNEKSDKLELIKIERQIPHSDTPLMDTINLLLKGPTKKEEKKYHLTTLFWNNTRLLNAYIKNGIAYLDFSPEIELGVGISMLRARLYQIVYTATQFPNIDGVRILINGKKKDVFSAEGLSIKRPLKRLSEKPIF